MHAREKLVAKYCSECLYAASCKLQLSRAGGELTAGLVSCGLQCARCLGFRAAEWLQDGGRSGVCGMAAALSPEAWVYCA